MYFRVATQVDAAPTWQWKSSVLSELATLFQFLRLLGALPHDQLRVFSTSSRQGLEEQLEQENNGLASTSVTAAQFLRERRIQPPAEMQRTSKRKRGTSLARVPIAGISQQPVNEPGRGGYALESRSTSALERRREELESGPGADHDLPYRFSLPLSLPQVLAWMRLLAKVHSGALQPL
jgi:hypothetical protein